MTENIYDELLQAEDEATEKISIEEFDRICEELAKQKAICEKMDEALTEENKKLEKLKAKVLFVLTNHNKVKYSSAGYTFSLQEKFSVKVPTDLEERNKMFEQFRRDGIYEQMRTVNSNTLNSFMNNRIREYAEKHELPPPYPGVGESKAYKILTIRKG